MMVWGSNFKHSSVRLEETIYRNCIFLPYSPFCPTPFWMIHSQSSRESFPGLCKNYAARKRVFSVSLRFAPFILPVFIGWGKRQIPLISPWLASVILQNFEFPHPFPSNSKRCREFSPAQGQRSQSIPLYSPTRGGQKTRLIFVSESSNKK